MRGLFVTGTDTEVGKTVVAAAICAALAARGERVAAFKPVVTGLDEAQPPWPPDHELLALAANAGQEAAGIAPHRFAPPLSPHLAAELAGARIDLAALRAEAAAAARCARADAGPSRGEDAEREPTADPPGALICEGVGGLLVPLAPDYLIRDLARDLGLPLVIAARPGLGTINHTLLTVEVARAAGLDVAAVVMTPWPADPTAAETSNRATVERLAGIPVHGLPPTDPQTLASAGSSLPLDDWL